MLFHVKQGKGRFSLNPVIARSPCDEAIQAASADGLWFASLAMTEYVVGARPCGRHLRSRRGLRVSRETPISPTLSLPRMGLFSRGRCDLSRHRVSRETLGLAQFPLPTFPPLS